MALQTPTALTKIKGTAAETSLLLCLSHLRWNFVFQRPQHLLTRAAKTHKVIYFEEPVSRERDEALHARDRSRRRTSVS